MWQLLRLIANDEYVYATNSMVARQVHNYMDVTDMFKAFAK